MDRNLDRVAGASSPPVGRGGGSGDPPSFAPATPTLAYVEDPGDMLENALLLLEEMEHRARDLAKGYRRPGDVAQAFLERIASARRWVGMTQAEVTGGTRGGFEG